MGQTIVIDTDWKQIRSYVGTTFVSQKCSSSERGWRHSAQQAIGSEARKMQGWIAVICGANMEPTT